MCGLMQSSLFFFSPQHVSVVPLSAAFPDIPKEGLADSWQIIDLREGHQSKLNMKNKDEGTIIFIHHLQSCVSNALLLSSCLQLGGQSLIALCE